MHIVLICKCLKSYCCKAFMVDTGLSRRVCWLYEATWNVNQFAKKHFFSGLKLKERLLHTILSLRTILQESAGAMDLVYESFMGNESQI